MLLYFYVIMMIPNDGGLFGRQKIPTGATGGICRISVKLIQKKYPPNKKCHSIHSAKIWLVNSSPCY